MARAKIKAVDVTPRNDNGRLDARFPDGVPTGGTPLIEVSQAIPSLTNLEAGAAYSEDFSPYVTGSGVAGATYSLVDPNTLQTISLVAVDCTFAGTTLSGTTPDAGTITVRLKVSKNGFDFVSNPFVRTWVTITVPDGQVPSVPVGILVTVDQNIPRVTLTGAWSQDTAVSGSEPSGISQMRIEKRNVTDSGSFAFLNSVAAPNGGTPRLWSDQQIGTSSADVEVTAGTISINSAGDGIGASTDNFRWAMNTTSGDFRLIATVQAITGIYEWANAGIMIRSTSAANSPFVAIRLTQGHGVSFIWRTPGGTLAGAGDVSWSGNATLRLDRIGNTFNAYLFTGTSWQLLGTQTINMVDPVLIGAFGMRSAVGTSGTFTVKDLIYSTLGDWTYQDNAVVAGKTYEYRISARDVAGNTSTFSSTVSAAISAPTTPAVKLHQGHYTWGAGGGYNAGETQLQQLEAHIDAIGNNPNIRGVAKFFGMGFLCQTAGNVSPGVTMINRILTRCMNQPYPKRLMLIPYLGRYGAGAGSCGPLYYPAFWCSNGWVTINNTGTTWPGATKDHAKVWVSGCEASIIDILSRIGDVFDSHPFVELIHIGETSGGVPRGFDGYTNQAMMAAYNRIHTAIKAHWQHTMLSCHTAWADSDSLLTGMFDNMRTIGGAAAGGTDPELPPPPDDPTLVPQGPRLYRAGNAAGQSGVVGTDYRPLLPYKGEVQWIGLGQSGYPQSTPSAIYTYFKSVMGAPYMVWSYNESVGTTAQRWSTGVLPLINANPDMNTNRPWPGNFNTN